MATTTTTVAAVKFADTLDITALSADQIAKFTDKDFAAFTTQQQSDLTNAQVKLLTAKQVAALPLKFVEPDTISGVDPKAISGMRLSNLSVEQFSALTSEQIQNIPATDFANLSAVQAAVLDELQVLGLSAAQVATIPSKSVASLMASTIEALSKAAVAGFTPENVIGLTTDTIQALTTEQANALSSKQINALKSNVLAQMEAEDLAALNLDALRGLNKKNITGVTLQALTPEQFGVLTPTQIKLLTPTQLSNLTEEFAPLFTSKVLMAMSAKQVEAVATSIVNTLDPLALKGFNTKNIKGLSSDQIATLTEEHAAVLTKSQVGALSVDQVGALPSATVIALTPMAFKGFSNSILATLSTEVISGLGEAVISVLTPAQLAAFTTTQVSALSGSQIQLLKPGVFNSFTDTGMANLGSEAISNLTTAQVAKLTTVQLGKFTPAQATNLSSEVKDWVVAKKFALLQSADTVAGGIQTTGTIVGTTLSETITSGAGNDTISTGGVRADSIDAGAGNDTITLTSSTTVATHTIKGGAGTDTLVFGGVASALTNISEIENLKLSTASSNQTLALGSGTGNSFASVDASILAVDKTLTLTGSVTNLNVAIGLGNLSAGSYTGGLNVTTIGGDSSIVTHTGADSIDAGAGNDTINAGQGADTIKGGTGADNFVFAAGDSGSPSSSFDTITDFSATDGDVIDFGSTAITIEQTAIALASGTARISATGLATFDDADNTLAKKIIATEDAIASGTLTAGEAALFIEGSDSYVFISDAVAGVGANDVLIKLAGGGAGGALGITNGDIVSVTGYTADTFGTAAAGLTASNAVYISDTGANINTALVEATNISPLLGTNVSSAYPKAAIIDGIDATDTDAISMTVGQEQALTAAKLSSDDTIHIVDTGAHIAAKITELVADVAKIDLLDANDDVVSITYAQAVALNAANLTFADNDVVTITDIADADVAAASALTITDLGGASLVLTGDGTVNLTQAVAAAQSETTTWAADQALTITATDNAGENIISAYDKNVLGGSGITLKGSDNAIALTYAQAAAQPADTKWSTDDAVTVSVTASNPTQVAQAAALSFSALGGSSLILDTTNTDISLPESVFATQVTNGAKWKSDVGITITSISNAATAQTAYNTNTLGGQSVTLDTGLSITATDLTAALAAGQQFSGTLTVTGVTDEAGAIAAFTSGLTGANKVVLTAADSTWSVDNSAGVLTTALSTNKQTFLGTLTVTGIATGGTAESDALTAFTNAKTGATNIILDADDNAWSVSASAMTTAMAAGIKVAASDVLTVTDVAVNGSNTTTNTATTIGAYSTTNTGAVDVVLDSISTANAWTVAYSDVAALSHVKFGGDDVVTVVVTDAEVDAASALTTTAIGGTAIVLDGDGGVSLSDALAKVQVVTNGVKWSTGDAVTIIGIGSTTTESTALTQYAKSAVGGSSVTLTATDGTWSVASDTTTSSDLDVALAAGIKLAGALTVTDILGTTTDTAAESTAVIAKYTLAKTGATSVVLDSKATEDVWTVSYADILGAGIADTTVKFGSDDNITVTVQNANEVDASALDTSVKGGTTITLNSVDSVVSLTATEASTQIAKVNTKWNSGDVVTVTAIADQAAALTTYNPTALGGSKTILETTVAGGWSVDDALLNSSITTAGANKLAFTTSGVATDKVTVTGILSANEAGRLTAYTKTALGAEEVVLDAADNTWSIAASGLDTALAAGIKVASADVLTITDVAAAGSNSATNTAATLAKYTTALTGATNIVLDSESTTPTDAWTIAYSDIAALTTVKFGSTDALTVVVPNANEVAASALDTSVKGGVSITLNSVDNVVSLTAAEATTQISKVNTVWNTDDVVTVTGIAAASNGQSDAVAAYRPSTLGGSKVILETSELTGWSVDDTELLGAITAATANKLAFTTSGATDNVTVTGISSTRETTGALTDYTKSALGAEAVVLDALDDTWSIASAGLTTALAAGIKFAAADTVTVTGVTAGAAALSAFTNTNVGTTAKVILNAGGAWAVSDTALSTALTYVQLAATDTLTVTVTTGSSSETNALTDFTKVTTGASSVALNAADDAWSVAASALDTALAAGTLFASGDTMRVTGIVTTSTPLQASAIAAYTPTKIGTTNVILDSSSDAWSMTESALAQKPAGATFSNDDTLTIKDISQTQESFVAVNTTPASPTYKYTSSNTGAKTVVLDAADDSWSITDVQAAKAITDGVRFNATGTTVGTADALTITSFGDGSTPNVYDASALSFAQITSSLGGATPITLDAGGAITLTVANVKDALAACSASKQLKFAATDTVSITMSTANDVFDFTTYSLASTNATPATTIKQFVFGGTTQGYSTTAGGVTFVDGGASATALDDGDKFLTATMDVITGFTTTTDKIDLSAFGAAVATGDVAAGVAGDFLTTGSLMADDTYQIVKGTYTASSGEFAVLAAGTDTLVVWDGDTTTAIDMVGVVLIGVTAVTGDVIA